MKLHRILGLVAAAALVVAGCANAGAPTGPASAASDTGTFYAALTMPGPVHDVAEMAFVVVDAADPDGCNGVAVASKVVPLNPSLLPDAMDANGAMGDNHPFADALFVLGAGDYLVCVAPRTAKHEASKDCAPVAETFHVTAGQTNEKVLVSQCQGDPNGAVDIPVELNDPPIIDLLEISPSKFITTCQVAELHATATDINGDPVSFDWSVLSKPALAQTWLAGNEGNMWFKACMAGDYTLQVTACDPHANCTSLTFPMHVLAVGAPFTVTQGGTSFQIGTLEGTTDVSTFYSYNSPDASSAHTGLEIEDKAVVFIYRNVNTNVYSLVMIFDVPHDQEGGQIKVQITGLAAGTTFAVKDDPGDSYSLSGGVANIAWNWQPCCTDGVALTLPDKYLCATVHPISVVVPSQNQPPNAYDWNFAWTDDAGAVQYQALPDRLADFTICHCLGGQPFPPAQ